MAPTSIIPSGNPSTLSHKILVALATYNERENIGRLYPAIRAILPNAEILVIDDNSPDGTGNIVATFCQSDPMLHLIRRAGKLGLGTALFRAIDYAKSISANYLIIMDADLSHPPVAIPSLLSGMAVNDIMIGSRYVPGGGTVGWPMSRRIISLSVNLLFRGMFRIPVKDASGSYRCYNMRILNSARTDKLISTGYSFLEELLYLCDKAGARIGETPIVFVERSSGVSKVNWIEAVRSLSTLVYLGIRCILGWDEDLKPIKH